MNLIVAGTYRIPPENLETLRPHAEAMMAQTRLEAGCVAYAFSEDLADRGLIHVFEVWRDRPAIAAHAASAHMKAWRAAGVACGVHDRQIVLYDIAAESPL
jgi:quinol monooxygenase YgiN